MSKVSVLLCVFNAAPYIREAIDSTLQQTYRDFELVIVDDGSTDETLQIIRSYDDARIRVFAGEHAYIRSLNLGLRQCRGVYIARMDADDKMEPDRLATQVHLMETQPQVAVCCSWARAFGEAEGMVGHAVRELVPCIYLHFLLGNFLIHPSSMIRTRFLRQHRLCYKEYLYAEDFKLWTDIARRGGQFYVIPRPLLQYRLTATQITNAHRSEQNATKLVIQQEIIEDLLRQTERSFRPRIARLYRHMLDLNREGLITGDTLVGVMFEAFKALVLRKAL